MCSSEQNGTCLFMTRSELLSSVAPNCLFLKFRVTGLGNPKPRSHRNNKRLNCCSHTQGEVFAILISSTTSIIAISLITTSAILLSIPLLLMAINYHYSLPRTFILTLKP